MPWKCHLQAHPLSIRFSKWQNGKLFRVIMGIKLQLPALLVNNLVEISLLVQQPYANYRDTQIIGLFELISCDISQTTGIDGKGLTYHKFHTEIGYTAQLPIGMIFI